MTKLKNSKFYKTQKLMWQNSKIPNFTKQNKKLKMWQNLKTENFTKLKNLKHDKKNLKIKINRVTSTEWH